MSEIKEQRRQIREAIALAGPDKIDGVCVGWAVVSEWVARDGGAWLSRLDGDGADEALTTWRRQGLLHNALHDAWEEEDE